MGSMVARSVTDRIHGLLTLPNRRFSVLRRSYRHASPKALPEPSLFFAALWSRCRLIPPSGRECQRTDKPLATNTPQPEHLWLVNAGGTAITFRPAHAAL